MGGIRGLDRGRGEILEESYVMEKKKKHPWRGMEGRA
jgi:hypothetical protein